MDILLGLGALVVLISVPTLLGLIYIELRQRRMFGPRTIISADHSGSGAQNHELTGIAMTLQSELERLRADVHGAISAVSTDVGQVREHLINTPAVAAPQVIGAATEPRTDPQRTTAISELYAALSKLDVSFLAVSSPVLLPGEQFDAESELPREVYAWESWNDVGAAAYQFAEAFSARRLYLDGQARDRLNRAIGSIRRCMTVQLYPVLTAGGQSINDEQREVVGTVVATLAANIQDARAELERSA